ncbi:thermonuclease family protein [Candidatus Parcubacteria bacterium]|nr:thermonuclease family protein [Patescibacteria group bacterium]MBU4380866.1 thermonuclease family protein [Patescibacteria group bacterium]MCG2688917.1 thermonuclease family protein [Candidatus Parcubacteria bacterium]
MPKKYLNILKTLVASLLFLYFYTNSAKKPVQAPSPVVESTQNLQKVTRVIDGDTIVMENGDHIRLIGIDASEIEPVKNPKCYAEEAKQYLTNLLENQTVSLEQDVSDEDRYNRKLRYVYKDALFINGELVKLGFAKQITYEPDVKYESLLKDLQQQAKKNNLGLWKECK